MSLISTTLGTEKRLPYDVVFLLNHFFDAVAGAVVDTGGMPNGEPFDCLGSHFRSTPLKQTISEPH